MEMNGEKRSEMGQIPIAKSSCIVCSIPCTQSCGMCKKVSYCSKHHQKSHWREHKMDCFPAILKSNEEFGRHFVASRDILQGELIFKEKSLVSGPSGRDGLFPVCLSCYHIVRSDFLCSKCEWPVCNVFCENDPTHSTNECPIFQNQGVNPFTSQEIHLYEKIIVLRGVLLKEKDPKAWLKIIDLQSHVEARRGTMKGCLLTNSAIKFVRDTCKQEQFSGKDIDQVVGALGTNAFSSEDNISCTQYFRSGSYLYYNGSLPAHSCVPNASWVIQTDSEYQLRASVNISTGEVITQLYTQCFVGTLERRKHLKESKYFFCHCERCSDPTELNTFFSGLTCNMCRCTYSKLGIILPRDSLKEDSDWVCNNKECEKTKSVKEVEKCISDVTQDIDLLSGENDLESIQALEETLVKYKSKVLHENHFLIYQLENDIMQTISYILTLNSTNHKLNRQQCHELSERLITLSRKCLPVVEVLCKGLSRHKGRLLYFLQQGLQVRILNSLNTNSKKASTKGKLNREMRDQIDELIELRREAGRIFENEPESREEYHLLNFIREYSKDMKNILRFYGSEK